MSLVKTISDKYNGIYSSEPLTKAHTPFGLFTNQRERATFKINNSNFSIYINTSNNSVEPFRINLILSSPTNKRIDIYPKATQNKIWNIFFGRFTINIPPVLNEQFVFKGNKKWLTQLLDSQIFRDSILNKRLYINKNSVKYITVTPENGIQTIEEFENIAGILIEIDKAHKQLTLK